MRNAFFAKYLLTALLSLCQATLIFAQDGHVKGKITNGHENLLEATVTVGNKTMVTNIDGEFFLTIKAGRYQLIITHAGYKKIEDSISIVAGNTQKLNYTLRPAEQMGEIVVLGSRSMIQRSNLASPVPSDVITSTQLRETGQISLTQMLIYSAPSANVSREILNEAVTLRGLDPQHVLILVNGIRYHNMAWLYGRGLKGQLGPGSVGNDLNSIPFSAIDKIEILRDGASAQYGSDAIAGVINLQLKKTTGKTSIQLHTGQFYAGDGEKLSVGINRGISLNKKGFLNFSASFRYQAATYRGGEYTGTVYNTIKAVDDSMINARGYDRKSHLDNVGNSKQRSAGLLINGGYPINNNLESFWTVAINGRKMELENPIRYPKNPMTINPVIYPDGLQAIGKPTVIDYSIIGGLKGIAKNNWHWDYSSSYGVNTYKGKVINGSNPSQSYLGANAQTSFFPGKDVYKLLTNDINFVKSHSNLNGMMKSLNLGWGAEWRMEEYVAKAGEEASWKNYDTVNYASAGAGGARDTSAEINQNRHVLGTYLDLEAEFSDRFLMSIAARYEHYSDYGDNIAAKIAARYKFSERFLLRASVNNGFRAPSLQQRWQNSVTQLFVSQGQRRELATRGIFPNNHELISALGIPLLTPEKSLNFSGGFTSTITKHFSLTVDAYWIQIKNRIVLSGVLDKTIPAVKKILESFPTIKVDQVQFFTNAINTNTKGIDIVFVGNWNINKSNLAVSLAANFNSTRLFGEIKTSDKLSSDSVTANKLFNTEDIEKMENEQPNDKIILSLIYRTGKTKLILRNTRFGKTSIAPIYQTPTRVVPESFSPKIITDLSLNYALKTWVGITLGVNNIFNVYPDPIKNSDNTVSGSRIYCAEASPFGFNGGYYYINLAFNW
jgi:iron complex outermembrane recepter protein